MILKNKKFALILSIILLLAGFRASFSDQSEYSIPKDSTTKTTLTQSIQITQAQPDAIILAQDPTCEVVSEERFDLFLWQDCGTITLSVKFSIDTFSQVVVTTAPETSEVVVAYTAGYLPTPHLTESHGTSILAIFTGSVVRSSRMLSEATSTEQNVPQLSFLFFDQSFAFGVNNMRC